MSSPVLSASGLDHLVQPDRVHHSVYTDPQIFDLEMEFIFGKTWVYVGHEGEVPNPGDYRLGYVGREPVIMARDRDGVVHVIYNRCLHRGSTICEFERGNSKNFRCPYHGWTYRADGSLLGVPFRKGYAGFDLDQLPTLRLPRVESCRGFVFASLDPEVVDLQVYLGGAREGIDNLVDRAPDGDLDVQFAPHKYIYRGNWKFQFENVLDLYHPTFSHESTLEEGVQFRRREGDETGFDMRSPDEESSNFDRSTQYAFKYGHGFFAAKVPSDERKGPIVEKYREQLRAALSAERYSELMSTRIHNTAIFPNLTFQETSQHIRLIRPISPDLTEVHAYPVRLKGAPDELHHAVIRYLNVTHSPSSFVQTDDTECFWRVQQGLAARGPEWLVFGRGINGDEPVEGRYGDGLKAVGTSELPQRNMFQAWKEMMAAGLGSR